MRRIITRKLEIDAGHRLQGHESKCRNVHGHRYVFEVTISAPKLDGIGRVVDFGVVKEKLGGWLDQYWDHAMIVEAGDPLESWLREYQQKHFVMSTAPTAENMAEYFRHKSGELLGDTGLTVERVRVYETPNCWADSTREA